MKPWIKQYPSWLPHEIEVSERNALEMFERSVQRVPDSPALHYFDRTLTYAQVDELATGFAAGLIDRGMNPGDRVGMFLQNVPQALVTVVGTWKAGGTVVPLNPMLKERELRYHLGDSGARFIVCLESLYPIVQEAITGLDFKLAISTSELDFLDEANLPAMLKGVSRVGCPGAVDMMELVGSCRGRKVERPRLGPDDNAFLTYTSGTTGPSKGATNTHGNVVFNSHLYQTWMRLGEGDVIAGLAPVFHITGLIGHFTAAMVAGIPVILFYRFDAGEALAQIERWKGTFTVAAITAYISLLDHPDIGKRDISSLAKAYSGGAPVSPAMVERFQAATGTYIHNIYGLTETTSPSHATPLGGQAPVDNDTGALSVGVPVCNTTVRIVDPESGQDLPPGSIGEVVTKGPMVVPGYWQKPEESAHAIRDGWLFTGDVGKMDDDGWFYIVDRTKDMIIASGYKVWPREVEDVLYQHPAVREASVIGVPDEYRGETVKAFVSLRAGQESSVSSEELVQFCRDRMAAYKYPRAVEIIDEVPKTLTGKFLRRELRQRRTSPST
ncbi:MAG: AMP-binding protein [Dehalococcoidia bacterium]|nr:AMP-binding protein [Dehalococcoidia bacterium]